MAGTLTWRGKQVAEKVMRAAQEAVDDVTEEAAKDAAASHWWGARTGTLTANIVNEPAKRRGNLITGRFGSTQTQGFYGLFLERRSPFLRPAADRTFSTLARRIKARLH